MRTALIAAAAAIVIAAPTRAADRNYSVTDFERVRVQGPVAVTLVTGSAPFARASGSPRALDGVVVRVEGQTLIIQADRTAWTGDDHRAPAGPVTIAVGTHDLRQASISGSGSLAIDQVRGQQFAIGVTGAASASVARADVDSLRLAQSGSGSVTLAGRAASLSALVRGSGQFDSTGLAVKELTLTAEGSASAHAAASLKATITAAGTAAIQIDGRPACTVKAIGSASVSGC